MESDSSLFDPLDYLIHYFENFDTDILSFGHSTYQDDITFQGNMSLNSARSRGHLSVPPFGGSVTSTQAGRSWRGANSLPARPNFHQAPPPFVDEGAGGMRFRFLQHCRPSTCLQSLGLPAREGLGNSKHVVEAFHCRRKWLSLEELALLPEQHTRIVTCSLLPWMFLMIRFRRTLVCLQGGTLRPTGRPQQRA